METGEKITSAELRHLVDLCNFCALCPCPPVCANLIEAKTSFIDRDGLKFGVRTLEDVERVAKLCGAAPQLANRLLRGKAGGSLVKKAAGIHPDRRIPVFPAENFPQWVRNQGLTNRPQKSRHRKIAYFAGCTANYLFPKVPRAVVEVLQYNGFDVFYPEQKCCGMAGIMGFKRDFHATSLHLGSRLMDRINALDPDRLITDCLSCRLQFNQLLPYKVQHPVELIREAYSFHSTPSGR